MVKHLETKFQEMETLENAFNQMPTTKVFFWIPYARHHNLVLIVNHSWILTIRPEFQEKSTWKNFLDFLKWVENIQAVSFNGTRTVLTLLGLWIKDDFKSYHFFLARTKKYNPNLTVGTGPCAKWFKGEECPFYPKFAIKEIFKVGCADAEGSYCDCIYFCWNNEDVTKFFAMGLKSEEYDDCTTRLNFSLILAGSVCKLWEKVKNQNILFLAQKLSNCSPTPVKPACQRLLFVLPFCSKNVIHFTEWHTSKPAQGPWSYLEPYGVPIGLWLNFYGHRGQQSLL